METNIAFDTDRRNVIRDNANCTAYVVGRYVPAYIISFISRNLLANRDEVGAVSEKMANYAPPCRTPTAKTRLLTFGGGGGARTNELASITIRVIVFVVGD